MSDRDRGPLWRRLAAIFDHPTLTPNERLLLVVLEWYAKDGVAWPSIPTLGRRTGLTERTVYSLVVGLEQGDVLAVEHGGGRRRSNHYEITLQPFQGFGGHGAAETLKPAPETLKSTHENPEAISGERSIERPTERPTSSPPPPAAGSDLAALNHDGADGAHASDPAAAPSGATAEGTPPAFAGKVIALADRLAANRRAPGAPAPLTPEQFEARRQALLAQAEAYESRRRQEPPDQPPRTAAEGR